MTGGIKCVDHSFAYVAPLRFEMPGCTPFYCTVVCQPADRVTFLKIAKPPSKEKNGLMLSENTALRNCDRLSSFPTQQTGRIFSYCIFTESFFVSLLQCTHPQLGDAGVSEHLGSDCGVGVDVLARLHLQVSLYK